MGGKVGAVAKVGPKSGPKEPKMGNLVHERSHCLVQWAHKEWKAQLVY